MKSKLMMGLSLFYSPVKLLNKKINKQTIPLSAGGGLSGTNTNCKKQIQAKKLFAIINMAETSVCYCSGIHRESLNRCTIQADCLNSLRKDNSHLTKARLIFLTDTVLFAYSSVKVLDSSWKFLHPF